MREDLKENCRICKWGPLKDCKRASCKWHIENNYQMLQRLDMSEWSRLLGYMWDTWLLKDADEDMIDAIIRKTDF